MMEPGTERELDYTERLFKKMPGWAVTATLFIGRMLIRVGRAGKKLWNKRKENQQRAFLTQLCEGKNGSEIEKIIKADPKLAKLIEPKKRGLIGRIIDKVRGITPEARQRELLQQPLKKFNKLALKDLITRDDTKVIEDRVNSHIKFKSSIDPVARAEYKTHLIDAKIQAQNAKKGVSALDVGNTMSRKGELSKLTDLTKHAIPQAKRLTAQNQRIIGGNTLTKGLQGQLLQAPVR